MLALLQHPQQWQRLVANPALIPAAAEEIIRWVSPINLFRRTAIRDTELAGQKIAEGAKVVLFYASANRDQDVFTSPQQFDIGRDPNPHLALGFGPHFCLGRHLAALELRVLLQAIAVLARWAPHVPPGGPAVTAVTRQMRTLNVDDSVLTMPPSYVPVLRGGIAELIRLSRH
jgi:cholest-4-en-3-one 26-monooxygenase